MHPLGLNQCGRLTALQMPARVYRLLSVVPGTHVKECRSCMLASPTVSPVQHALATVHSHHQRAVRYLAVRNTIVAKRAASGVDDAVLAMTTGLLGTLPDFMTMWNWRREGLTLKWQG